MKHHVLLAEYFASLMSFIFGVVTNSEVTTWIGIIAGLTTIIRNLYLMKKDVGKIDKS